MALRFPSAIPGRVPTSQGKTRDMFPARAKKGPYVGKELLLIVASDRLSTHNIVHESAVPRKGKVLTALSVFWMTQVFPSAGIRHHLVASGGAVYDYLDGGPGDYPPDLDLRSIVVEKLPVAPIEFIYRARLGGSLYEKFYSKGLPNPYGVVLPPGLSLMSEFPEVIFTPTEKSEDDDPLNADDVIRQYPLACALARKTFVEGRKFLLARGIDGIDTKLEVAFDADGNPVIVDEVLTPDSSRFCPSGAIVLGSEPPYADKQIARDEAVRIWGSGPRGPLTFGLDIVRRLTDTYLGIFTGITGYSLKRFQQEALG